MNYITSFINFYICLHVALVVMSWFHYLLSKHDIFAMGWDVDDAKPFENLSEIGEMFIPVYGIAVFFLVWELTERLTTTMYEEGAYVEAHFFVFRAVYGQDDVLYKDI